MTFDNGAIIIIFPPFLISLFAKQLVKYFLAREDTRQGERVIPYENSNDPEGVTHL